MPETPMYPQDSLDTANHLPGFEVSRSPRNATLASRPYSSPSGDRRNGIPERPLALPELDDAMRRWLSPRSVIVGVGNADRGDDAFGPAVIRLLAGRLPPEALVDAGPCPENYLGVIVQHHPGVVLILDAGELGEPPGSLTLCGPRDLVGGGISCHAGNLALLCAWIENLTGAACHLLLAQAARVSGYADREADRAAGPHIGLSPPVEAAARRAADAILAAGQFKAPCDFGGQHVS